MKEEVLGSMRLLRDEQGILTALEMAECCLKVEIHKKPKFKRISLRLNAARTSLIVKCAHTSKISFVEDFIQNSQNWIEKKLKDIGPGFILKPGAQIVLFGNSYKLVYRKGSPATVKFYEDQVIISCSSPDNFVKILEKGLREKAHQFFHALSITYAAALGTKPHYVKVRDFKGRWGSCSASGDLSYSWRLIFAPLEVAQYVCAHEVSHLKEMNHSPRFWSYVKVLCPFHKVYRGWLRQEGASLFRTESS